MAQKPITVDVLKDWCNKFNSESATLRDLHFVAISLEALHVFRYLIKLFAFDAVT